MFASGILGGLIFSLIHRLVMQGGGIWVYMYACSLYKCVIYENMFCIYTYIYTRVCTYIYIRVHICIRVCVCVVFRRVRTVFCTVGDKHKVDVVVI